MYTIMTALHYRRANRWLFERGEYILLDAHGSRREHLCAFSRLHGDQAVVAVVPRLVASLTDDPKRPPIGSDVWGDTGVNVPFWRPASLYRNLLTGESLLSQTAGDHQMLPLADILRECPVALLERLT